MELTLTIIGLGITLLLALLGWAYNLGFLGARVQRNEKDIAELRKEQAHSEEALRESISKGFDKVFKKLDELPCHNPKWNRDKCEDE